MPENRSEAFEGRYSFSNDKVQVRPETRPKSIIERPDNRENNRENSFSSEPSWSTSNVTKFEKQFVSDKKIKPPVKVNTSGGSYYKRANMQMTVKQAPYGSPHKISYGETLSDIAAKNNVSVDRLAQANKIKNPNRIYAGQKIYIPRGVNELDGPEADGINAPREKSVFDRIKGFFSGGRAGSSAGRAGAGAGRGGVAIGPDPSGIMSPSLMTKYRVAVARDNKKIITNTSQIKNAQTILTDMGYNPNGIDGDIGPGTRRAVRKLQAQHGLEITGVLTPKILSLLESDSVQDYPDKPNFKAVPISFDAKDMSIYSKVIAGIESGGEADPYAAMGGAGKSYVGKYQLGKMALEDLNYGYSPDKIKALLADPKKQEELFKEFTDKNHKELTRVSKEYREMSKEEQLSVLGYAHNQGATAAAEFLFTGVVGSDAFDTEGTKYTKAIVEALGGDFEEPTTTPVEYKKMLEASTTSGLGVPPGVAMLNLPAIGGKIIEKFKDWTNSTSEEKEATKRNWQPSVPGDVPPWIEIPKNKYSKEAKIIDKKTKIVRDFVRAFKSPVVKNMLNDMVWGGKSIGGKERVAGAEIYSPGTVEIMREMALDLGLKPGGTVTIGEDVYKLRGSGISVNQNSGSSVREILAGLAEGNPEDEIKLMMGQFDVSMDMNGRMTTEDQFNYNDFINPIDGKRYNAEEYEIAIAAGKFTEGEVLGASITKAKWGYPMIRAVAFVLGSKDYIGKDNPLDEGRYMRVDLGTYP
jgi:LysM repeat protein